MSKLIGKKTAGLVLAAGTMAGLAFAPATAAFAQDQAPTQQGADQQGPTHDRKGQIKRHAAKAVIKDAAGVIGISPADLVKELRSGQSIAGVATAHGVDPQAVVDKLVADATARIDQAVANGKIPADKAAEIKANLNDRVTKLVNRTFDGSHRPGKGATPDAN